MNRAVRKGGRTLPSRRVVEFLYAVTSFHRGQTCFPSRSSNLGEAPVPSAIETSEHLFLSYPAVATLRALRQARDQRVLSDSRSSASPPPHLHPAVWADVLLIMVLWRVIGTISYSTTETLTQRQAFTCSSTSLCQFGHQWARLPRLVKR
jgi:hypothetical protein